MIETIAEYLASIGFKVDKASFDEATKHLGHAEKAVHKFTFALSKNPAFKAFSEFMDKLTTQVAEFAATTEGALVIGGAAFASFSTIATAGIGTFMAKMAAADLDVKKFAISLYTTVGNARSLKTVMDAMGLKSMDDLKYVNLIPEQRAQFLEMRKLAAGLTPGADTEGGLANIRRVGYEFQKLQLQLTYFWTYTAGALGKLLEGPLKGLTKWMEGINGALNHNMGRWSTYLAGFFEIFVRVTDILAKVGSALFKMVPFLDKIPPLLKLILDVTLFLLRKVDDLLGKHPKAGALGGLLGGGLGGWGGAAAGAAPVSPFAGAAALIPGIGPLAAGAIELGGGLTGGILGAGGGGVLGAGLGVMTADQLSKHGGMNKAAFQAFADQMTEKYKLPHGILRGLINQESGWNVKARSSVGAMGIAQFMPGTAKGMGVNPRDPYSSIEGAARYLHNGLAHFHGNIASAVASYNAGFGAVDKYHGVPPYKETQHYVRSILAQARQVPPIHISISGVKDPELAATLASKKVQGVIMQSNLRPVY